MTEVTRHEPGAFSWAELATSDPKGARDFYTSLFGWTWIDNPIGSAPEDVYTRLQLSGKDVGALYRMLKEQQAQGIPPNWLCYVTVESADAAAKKTMELGGTVIAPPFDVMGYGRMAMLQDPTGATLAVWQPGTSIGAQRVNEPGAFCWMELMTPDPATAKSFYKGLFGWGVKESTDPGMPYTELQVAGRSMAGIFPMTPQMGEMPPRWIVYWQVTDCDAAAARASSLGAKVMEEPKDIPRVGRFALIQDPQGAMFSIFQLV